MCVMCIYPAGGSTGIDNIPLSIMVLKMSYFIIIIIM